MIKTSVDIRDGTVHVSVSGRMDGGPCCHALRDDVKALVADGQRDFVFDLTDLVSMSSRGIGCLVSNYASIDNVGGSMVLQSPNERVYHVLEVTRLVPAVFAVIDEQGEAYAADTTPKSAPPPPRSKRDEDEVDSPGRSASARDLGETRRRRGQHGPGLSRQGVRPRR